MKAWTAAAGLLAASCSRSPEAPVINATPAEQRAIRLALAEAQVLMFCAGYDRARWDRALAPARELAREKGVQSLVDQTRADWDQAMATADIACPRDRQDELARRGIDELERSFRAVRRR